MQAGNIALYGGYVPSLVWHDRAGHLPMKSAGLEDQPWVWGKTLQAAQTRCDAINRNMGLSPQDCIAIMEASQKMTGTIRT